MQSMYWPHAEMNHIWKELETSSEYLPIKIEKNKINKQNKKKVSSVE